MTKTERNMIACIMTVNNQIIGTVKFALVTVARRIPHGNFVAFFDRLTMHFHIFECPTTHICERCLPTDATPQSCRCRAASPPWGRRAGLAARPGGARVFPCAGTAAARPEAAAGRGSRAAEDLAALVAKADEARRVAALAAHQAPVGARGVHGRR